MLGWTVGSWDLAELMTFQGLDQRLVGYLRPCRSGQVLALSSRPRPVPRQMVDVGLPPHLTPGTGAAAGVRSRPRPERSRSSSLPSGALGPLTSFPTSLQVPPPSSPPRDDGTPFLTAPVASSAPASAQPSLGPFETINGPAHPRPRAPGVPSL